MHIYACIHTYTSIHTYIHIYTCICLHIYYIVKHICGYMIHTHTHTYEVKKVKVLVTELCPTLCNPMDCRPPGSSVYGILQARTLEWVVISFSRGSSWSRDRTQVSCVAGRFFTVWATLIPFPAPTLASCCSLETWLIFSHFFPPMLLGW